MSHKITRGISSLYTDCHCHSISISLTYRETCAIKIGFAGRNEKDQNPCGTISDTSSLACEVLLFLAEFGKPSLLISECSVDKGSVLFF